MTEEEYRPDDNLEAPEKNAEEPQPRQKTRRQSYAPSLNKFEKLFSVTGFPPPRDNLDPNKKKITQLEWLMPDYESESAGEAKEIKGLAEELESAAGVQKRQEAEKPAPKPIDPTHGYLPAPKPVPPPAPPPAPMPPSEIPELPRSLHVEIQRPAPEKPAEPVPRQSGERPAQDPSGEGYSREALAKIPTPKNTGEAPKPSTRTRSEVPKQQPVEAPPEPRRVSRLPKSFAAPEEDSDTAMDQNKRKLSAARASRPPSRFSHLLESHNGKIAAIAGGSILAGFTIGIIAFLIMPKKESVESTSPAKPVQTVKKPALTLPFVKPQYKTTEEAEAAADTALLSGNLQEAMDALNQGLKINAGSKSLMQKRGLTYLLQKQYTEAQHDLAEVLTASPRFLPALFDRAALSFAQEHYKEAQSDYNLILAIEPGNADALLGLSLCKFKQKDSEAGLTTLSRITTREHDYSPAHRAAGEEFLRSGDFDRAEAAFSRALEKDGKNADLYALRGRSNLLKGNNQQAVKDFEEAVKLAPDNANFKSDLEVARKEN
ncbi:MAG TPA: tetratricopeptide repeat protein [Candidatus Obscuribacter sp.]|nr:tetratricopeptide repeat protein [Candidatus Obscuribacter sp.]MBK9276776.1 tetratricopeptide repeat protein [Candidatus Obscuribacter sp.]HND65692.1 tetratricopeptide repeat protein [Candidatus Obscuribacter sp.]